MAVLLLPLGTTLAAVQALSALIVIELVFVLVRRLLPKFHASLLLQVWTISIAVLVLVLGLPDSSVSPGLLHLVQALALVLSGVAAHALLDVALLQRPWNRRRGPVIPRLARGALGFVIVVVLALIALKWILRVDVTTISVASTVLTATVAFALQDLLKDLLAGVALQMERPFGIGDWLLLDGAPAQVVEISWRATHLRTTDGVDVYEPNHTLAQARLLNYGQRRPTAWNLRVGLPYDAAPSRIKEAILDAVRHAPGVLADPAPEVFLESYADSSIVYRIRAWTDDFLNLNSFIDTINSRVWYAMQRAGVSFPFPTRTVNLHHADDTARSRRDEDAHRTTALFASIDLFHSLSPDAIAQLAAAAHREHHDAGEILVREGDDADSLYLIASGEVVVRKGGSGGSSVVELARLASGDFFGEASLLTGEPRSASVVATEACEVLVVTREALAPLLAADPSLAEGLSETLAWRSAATSAKLEGRRRSAESADKSASASILRRMRAFFHLE